MLHLLRSLLSACSHNPCDLCTVLIWQNTLVCGRKYPQMCIHALTHNARMSVFLNRICMYTTIMIYYTLCFNYFKIPLQTPLKKHHSYSKWKKSSIRQTRFQYLYTKNTPRMDLPLMWGLGGGGIYQCRYLGYFINAICFDKRPWVEVGGGFSRCWHALNDTFCTLVKVFNSQ